MYIIWYRVSYRLVWKQRDAPRVSKSTASPIKVVLHTYVAYAMTVKYSDIINSYSSSTLALLRAGPGEVAVEVAILLPEQKMASRRTARFRQKSTPEHGQFNTSENSTLTMQKKRSRLLSLAFGTVDAVVHSRSVVKFAFTGGAVLVLSIVAALDWGVSGTLRIYGTDVLDFSARENAVNQYFVKISWFWTLVCVVPLAMSSGYLLRGLSLGGLLVSAARMVVATVAWWSLTTLFLQIDDALGLCSNGELIGKVACYRERHTWIGFDISGHVFLLTYSVLLLTEECQAIKVINSLQNDHGPSINMITADKLRQMWARDVLKFSKSFVQYSKVLCFIFIVCAGVMVCATCLFFHTFTEKILGLLLAGAVWWLTYQTLFPRSFLDWMPVPQRFASKLNATEYGS